MEQQEHVRTEKIYIYLKTGNISYWWQQRGGFTPRVNTPILQLI